VSSPASVAVAALILVASCGRETARPLQGYVEGEYVRVAAPFAGTLQQLSVKRGDQVEASRPLFALENENETAARREARSVCAPPRRGLSNLQTGKRAPEIETATQELQQARAMRELASSNVARQQKLYASGFVSRAVLDDAQAQFKREDAHVKELEAALATAKMPARTDEIRAAEADARPRRKVLAQSEWKLAQRAGGATRRPGLVTTPYFVVGDWVPAGSPVASVLPPANVKDPLLRPEPLLGGLKLGQPVTVNCDGCAGAVHGDDPVHRRSRRSSRRRCSYSKENRAKLVYLVEAKPAPADARQAASGTAGRRDAAGIMSRDGPEGELPERAARRYYR
jgi:HlyD family secretion protein